ncbi:MAG TPA: EamA family transporter [Vitreimonas sp.]|nr:EamA family transporter [Vitreimonas sp.]
MSLHPLLYALIAYIGWGSGDIFGVFASRKLGSESTALWIFLVSLIGMSCYLPFSYQQLSLMTPWLMLQLALLGLLFTSANVAIYEALVTSQASLAGTIVGSYSVFVVLFSFLMYGTAISAAQLFFIMITFAGLVIATLNFQDLRNSSLLTDRGVWIAIYAAISAGLFFTFSQPVVTVVGSFWPIYISMWFFPARDLGVYQS